MILQMPKVIISDTSCLIILSKIGKLDLLEKLYGRVYTTLDIAQEFGEPIPNWLLVKDVADEFRQKILEMQIDKGESSAIALALETPESILILDDYKARKIASHLGLALTGTVGVIIKAKMNGIVLAVKPILEEIKKTNFRISPELEILALKEAGEL
jgi:predicted nucleic acid-binding protein